MANHIYNDIKTGLCQAIESEQNKKGEAMHNVKNTVYRVEKQVIINGQTRAEDIDELYYGVCPQDKTVTYPSFDAFWDQLKDPRSRDIPHYFFETSSTRKGRVIKYWKFCGCYKVTPATLWQAELRIKYIPLNADNFSMAMLADRLRSKDFIHFLNDKLPPVAFNCTPSSHPVSGGEHSFDADMEIRR